MCKERWQLNEGRHLLSSPYRSLFLKGVMLEGQEKCIFILTCHTIQSTLFGHCCTAQSHLRKSHEPSKTAWRYRRRSSFESVGVKKPLAAVAKNQRKRKLNKTPQNMCHKKLTKPDQNLNLLHGHEFIAASDKFVRQRLPGIIALPEDRGKENGRIRAGGIPKDNLRT